MVKPEIWFITVFVWSV